MAFTRKQKESLLKEYSQWISDSQAYFVLSYGNMTMRSIDELRARIRNEADGHIHVVKNTLFKLAMDQAGVSYDTGFTGRSLIGFANSDAPTLAKILNESCKGNVFEFKIGYFDGKTLSVNEIKALAELPPLPVMRATLLGVISAPASKLVRTLAEPARSMAAVVKSYSEADAVAA
ncbi:MAG: 50S ribosomal protein L10 [Anaerolineaceae bacterium]|nr:50S ribosomal protein L10 [Anaerolineaceae bacterium]